MNPQGHIVVSLGLSILFYYIFKSSVAAFGCFAAGVFIDIDHLLEYSIKEEEDFRLIDLFNLRLILKHWNDPYNLDRFFLLFHAYEFSVLLGLISIYLLGPYVGIAIFIGHLAHLVIDNSTNYVHPLTYFFFYRINHNFDAEKLYSRERLLDPLFLILKEYDLRREKRQS